MAASRDDIATLLQEADALSGLPAAEAFVRAAKVQRPADPVGALRSLDRALASLGRDSRERRRVAAIEMGIGAIHEQDLGRLEEAIAHYQRAFKADFDYLASIEAGRRIYRSLGDYKMVAALFEVQLDVTSGVDQRAELLVQLGRTLASEVHDPVSAAARLEEALKLKPDDQAARELLSGVYADPDFPPVGDGRAAPARAVQLLLDLAVRRARAGDTAGRIGFLRRALGVDPGSGEAARALEEACAGDLEGLRTLYRHGEGIAHRVLKLSAIAEAMGDRDEALACARASLDDPSEREEAVARLDRLLAREPAARAALRDDFAAQATGAERAERLIEAAALYLEAGRARTGIERLERALAIAPTHPRALAMLERELSARREHARFTRALEAAAEVAPEGERITRLTALGEHCERKVGDLGAALEAWGQVEALARAASPPLPEAKRAAEERRRLATRIDRGDAQLALLARDLEGAGEHSARADVWRRTAQVYRDRHDIETAAALYEQVLEERPDDQAILRALTDMWEREGDPGRALAVLRRQLETRLGRTDRVHLLRRAAQIADERLDDVATACWACREILGDLPGDREALQRLAAVCERSGDEDGLLAALEAHAQAAASPLERVSLLVRAAELCERRGEANAAAVRREQAAALQPPDPDAIEALARCYQAAGRFTDLAALLSQGLAGADHEGWRRYARIVDGRPGRAASSESKSATRAEQAWREVATRLPKDREALDALCALAREGRDDAGLAALLAQRVELSDQPREAVALGIEHAEVLDRLHDAVGAAAAYERLIADVAPRSIKVHATLRRRYEEAGDIPQAVRIAERELLLTDDLEERLEIALYVADLWRERDPRRAIEAYERVRSLVPDQHDALEALAALYRDAREWRRLITVDERRLAVADPADAFGLLSELAEVCERGAGEPAAAFAYRRRAWELQPGDGALAELRRLATAHGLWDRLIAALETRAGLQERREIASIWELRLGDPTRALQGLIDALAKDPGGPDGAALLAEIERLASVTGAPSALLEAWELRIATAGEAERIDLVGRRARIREAAGDPGGAFVDRLRHYALAPDSAEVLVELRRLAEVTGRWDDLLTVANDRFRRARGEARIEIACEAARLAETRIKDPLKAFRAALAAFSLSPDDAARRSEVQRLARTVGPIPDPARRRTPAEGTELAEPASGPLLLPEPTLRERSAPQNGDARGQAPRFHTAFDEIERACLALPAATAEQRALRMIPAARAWEQGAGSVDRAFDVLARALPLAPEAAPLREELGRLAAAHGAWDRLVEILDRAVDEATELTPAVRLRLDAAAGQERAIQAGGSVDDLAERYQRILALQPECAEARVLLEVHYRTRGRWAELAEFQERRLAGPAERLPGPERQALWADLARTREALGRPAEALDAWSQLLALDDRSLDALRAFARLHDDTKQWPRTLEILARLADLAPAEEARAARQRRAEIFEIELGLPERAVDEWRALDDPASRDALERLYARLHRHRELADLLCRRCDEERLPPETRAGLLERRARLHADALDDPASAVACWRELSALRPDDDLVAAALCEALARTGDLAGQAGILRRRIASARWRKAETRELVNLHLALGLLLAGPLADPAAARRTLDEAIKLCPDDPDTLAQRALIREGGPDWAAYADARTRQADLASDGTTAARALCEAGRAFADRLSDPGAARRCFERALERDRDPACREALAALAALDRRGGDDARADELVLRELAATPKEAVARRAALESDLAASALRRGDGAAAGLHFRAALEADAGFLDAQLGLAAVAEADGQWTEAEGLLAGAAKRPGLSPGDGAALWRRIAAIREQLGQLDPAREALLEAARLAPTDLTLRLALGDHCFRAEQWADAVRYFSSVAKEPGVPTHTAAEASCSAAQAEVKLGHSERAEALYRRALELAPDLLAPLAALAALAALRGDLAAAAELHERRAEATPDPAERSALLEEVADLFADELHDPVRARAVLARAAAASPSGNERILRRRFELAREAGDLGEAIQHGAQLIARASNPTVKAERLKAAAAVAVAAGRIDEARTWLRESVAIDPHDEPSLVELTLLPPDPAGEEAMAKLLQRTLKRLPIPEAEQRGLRARLWKRLGEARGRLDDDAGAIAAFERALEIDPSLSAVRGELVTRYDGAATHDPVARRHLALLIAERPLDVPSLRALAKVEARRGDALRTRRLIELLAVAGAATDEELRALRRSTRSRPPEEDWPGTLQEADHQRLAHPEARPLGGLFETLWEAVGPGIPALPALAVTAGDAPAKAAGRGVAQLFDHCARALGNRRSVLVVRCEVEPGIALSARPPTAIVLGARLAEGRVSVSLRFLLGRALEMARPEYVLGAALPSDEFLRLFGPFLRAFHPVDERAAAAEVARWSRELPGPVARRLDELLATHAETGFSTTAWRRAVQHTGNRAGLLLCGDLVAACAILRAEGDEAAIEDLARFAASDDYVALSQKLLCEVP
ncbi:MAG: hypothetical protein EXR72_16275 [Myxococcales bacterium]|nr:hypothetical protein [Myxococcales bacterium]